MADLAQLVISVDSTGVRDGARELDNLTRAGGFAEKSVAKLFAMAGGAYGLARAIKSVADQAMEFEHSMATVGTVIDDRGKIPQLTSQIRALSAEMGQMPAASARAMYDIVSAGATDASKAMDILATSNKLAVGGATEVGIAADGLTSIMSVYAGSVKNATEVADKMFVSAAVGKTTISELSHHIGMVAPIANTAGVSLGELLGAVGALTKGGLNTATAVTGIRSFLAQVVKHSDEASKAAKAVGFDYDVAALKAKGFLGFVEDLKAKTGGNVDILGKIVGDIEGLNAALSLTGPMSKDFRDAIQAMGDSAGKTNEAFGVMAETAQFKMDQLKAKISNKAIEAGQALLSLVPVDGLVRNFDAIAGAAAGLAKALTILLAMKSASWVAEWLSNMKMKIDVMIAARGHAIAWIQSDVAAAAAALATTKANRDAVVAQGARSSMWIHQRAQAKLVAAAELEVAGATNAHTAALNRLNAAQSLGSVAGSGLRAVVSALGGPVGIVTGLVTLGIMAWNNWGSAAKTAGQEAKDAMDKAAGGAQDAMKALQGQVDQARAKDRLASGKTESAAYVGKGTFDKADESTLQRVRQLVDSINSAEKGYDAIMEGRTRFKSLNDRVHAEQALLNVVTRSKAALQDLARLEGERVKTLEKTKAVEVAPASNAFSAADGVLKDLQRQNVLLTEGERAAFAFELAGKGLTQTEKAKAMALWETNRALKDGQDRQKQLEKEAESYRDYVTEVYALAAKGPEKTKELDSVRYMRQEGERLTEQMLTQGSFHQNQRCRRRRHNYRHSACTGLDP
jgi:TP901 family phage tail tape measure protein